MEMVHEHPEAIFDHNRREVAQENVAEGFPLYASCHLGLIVGGHKGNGPIRAALILHATQYVPEALMVS
jgi:uncharacterized MAPEG superfamily protein